MPAAALFDIGGRLGRYSPFSQYCANSSAGSARGPFGATVTTLEKMPSSSRTAESTSLSRIIPVKPTIRLCVTCFYSSCQNADSIRIMGAVHKTTGLLESTSSLAGRRAAAIPSDSPV
ncbi:MAG: hypothetical protein ACLSB9_26150 [Hydrogeniiclostridium mannosilyticum]